MLVTGSPVLAVEGDELDGRAVCVARRVIVDECEVVLIHGVAAGIRDLHRLAVIVDVFLLLALHDGPMAGGLDGVVDSGFVRSTAGETAGLVLQVLGIVLHLEVVGVADEAPLLVVVLGLRCLVGIAPCLARMCVHPSVEWFRRLGAVGLLDDGLVGIHLVDDMAVGAIYIVVEPALIVYIAGLVALDDLLPVEVGVGPCVLVLLGLITGGEELFHLLIYGIDVGYLDVLMSILRDGLAYVQSHSGKVGDVGAYRAVIIDLIASWVGASVAPQRTRHLFIHISVSHLDVLQLCLQLTRLVVNIDIGIEAVVVGAVGVDGHGGADGEQLLCDT